MPPKPTTSSLPRNGVEILVDWANEQDQWVRAIVAEVIAARRELPEASITAAYEQLLAEKGLSPDLPKDVPKLSAEAAPTENAEDLRVTRLANVTGVNALASGQEIAFNKKLTILFGENAAGKTGYVRVLKRIASVRSAQPILGNVHAPTTAKRHATIEYTLSGTAKSLDWNDETGVPPFTRISVFDSGAVALHVDEDLTYVVTPGELALFLNSHRAIEAVKVRLDREKTEAQAKTSNPFLHRFVRDAAIYPTIETLGPSTSIAELEKLADVTLDEESSVSSLRDRVEALQPQASNSRLLVAASDRDLYRAIRDAAAVAQSFSWEQYSAAIKNVRTAEENYAAASSTAFTGSDIPAIFGDAWKAFILAGERYLEETGAPEYPGSGDHCPYCRQDLDAKALALVRKYRDYCNNEPKLALDAALQEAKRLAAPVVALKLAELRASCERRSANFQDPSSVPPLLTRSVAFLGKFERFRAEITATRPVADVGAFVEIARGLVRDAEVAVAQAEAAITDLTRQADERKKELEAASASLRSLENRMTLRSILPDVRRYVERAQWAARAAPIINRITGTLRSLTEQSKLASKQLLDTDFERLFDLEREALRAPKVRLDFAGRKGQAARKKTLVSDHRLSEILSEGEQKVIALADFLAEVGLHRTTAPIVFDDPVNSLDYKRLQYVVDRIVELSATRQVIVFTHSIWFATELLSRFEKATSDCTYYGISESGGSTGYVNRGTHPRWDTVKSLTGKVNGLIQSAGSATGETQTALVETAYGDIRSWCEVVVEQELLAGVTQRYQPNVAMTKLPQIKADRLTAARDVIQPLFEKACRIMTAHSQPLEVLSIRPTLEELKKDWAAAKQAREAYLN